MDGRVPGLRRVRPAAGPAAGVLLVVAAFGCGLLRAGR
jgi:hypothetical protein